MIYEETLLKIFMVIIDLILLIKMSIKNILINLVSVQKLKMTKNYY